MSYCKYCGARIDWIRTPEGKYTPVEPGPVVVMPDRGTDDFITDEGERIKGKRALAGPIGGNLVAYKPHWTRCSARKKRGD